MNLNQTLRMSLRRWVGHPTAREPAKPSTPTSHAVADKATQNLDQKVDALLATLSVSPAMLLVVPGDFDARGYLARNPDLLEARVNPWEHYVSHGQAEGRTWCTPIEK